jgi:hypothetical protein
MGSKLYLMIIQHSHHGETEVHNLGMFEEDVDASISAENTLRQSPHLAFDWERKIYRVEDGNLIDIESGECILPNNHETIFVTG